MVNDAPIVFTDQYTNTDWRPRNSGGDFLGPIRLREALYRSRNLVSVRLMQDLGVDNALTYMERFGFAREELPRNLSASLGTPELTPLQIAQGYTVIANGGYAVKPYLIERIQDRDWQTIHIAQPAMTPERLDQRQAEIEEYRRNASPEESKPVLLAEQVVDPRTTYQLTSMLKDVINRGTAVRAKSLERADLAGKTGTTNDQKDGWFSGYNADLVAIVWVGFDQPAPLGRREYGGTTALPTWMKFMEKALEDRPENSQPMPDGMMTMRIDPNTGRSARPGTSNGILEVFKEEDAPPSFDEVDANGYRDDGAVTPLELF